MGHYYETVTAIGRDVEDAKQKAVDGFLYEHGNRHSVRGVEAKSMLGKVPPTKTVETKLDGFTRVTVQNDESAPADQWREKWEIEIHTHA